ncbi:Hypothetical predicted protein [Marmota monax]|uniref:Ras-related protein Rab-26 n=1 Tax=Marmota monax TaxID=9995 RepID=A0A5E4CZS5_MARMO|nr:Hypothetical predicted protein [Marmota monax]
MPTSYLHGQSPAVAGDVDLAHKADSLFASRYLQVQLKVCICPTFPTTPVSAFGKPPPPTLKPRRFPTPRLIPSRRAWWCSLWTILVGDSGVGKTSLLVQFDQGKFIPGSFSATVGIGFTVSTRWRCGVWAWAVGKGRAKPEHSGDAQGPPVQPSASTGHSVLGSSGWGGPLKPLHGHLRPLLLALTHPQQLSSSLKVLGGPGPGLPPAHTVGSKNPSTLDTGRADVVSWTTCKSASPWTNQALEATLRAGTQPATLVGREKGNQKLGLSTGLIDPVCTWLQVAIQERVIRESWPGLCPETEYPVALRRGPGQAGSSRAESHEAKAALAIPEAVDPAARKRADALMLHAVHPATLSPPLRSHPHLALPSACLGGLRDPHGLSRAGGSPALLGAFHPLGIHLAPLSNPTGALDTEGHLYQGHDLEPQTGTQLGPEPRGTPKGDGREGHSLAWRPPRLPRPSLCLQQLDIDTELVSPILLGKRLGEFGVSLKYQSPGVPGEPGYKARVYPSVIHTEILNTTQSWQIRVPRAWAWLYAELQCEDVRGRRGHLGPSSQGD